MTSPVRSPEIRRAVRCPGRSPRAVVLPRGVWPRSAHPTAEVASRTVMPLRSVRRSTITSSARRVPRKSAPANDAVSRTRRPASLVSPCSLLRRAEMRRTAVPVRSRSRSARSRSRSRSAQYRSPWVGERCVVTTRPDAVRAQQLQGFLHAFQPGLDVPQTLVPVHAKRSHVVRPNHAAEGRTGSEDAVVGVDLRRFAYFQIHTPDISYTRTNGESRIFLTDGKPKAAEDSFRRYHRFVIDTCLQGSSGPAKRTRQARTDVRSRAPRPSATCYPFESAVTPKLVGARRPCAPPSPDPGSPVHQEDHFRCHERLAALPGHLIAHGSGGAVRLARRAHVQDGHRDRDGLADEAGRGVAELGRPEEGQYRATEHLGPGDEAARDRVRRRGGPGRGGRRTR
jgi:hypothetical protein